MKIGEWVKKYRAELGCCLRQRGRQAHLKAGFLNRVENTRVPPSLDSLQTIATALRVPTCYLLTISRQYAVVNANEDFRPYLPGSHMGYDRLTSEIAVLARLSRY